MSAERGWIVEPQPARHGVEKWVAHHRGLGHHPHPAPTEENPERWECKCDPDAPWTAVWRILTPEQVRQKFAHLTRTRSDADSKDKPRRVICSLGTAIRSDRSHGIASAHFVCPSKPSDVARPR